MADQQESAVGLCKKSDKLKKELYESTLEIRRVLFPHLIRLHIYSKQPAALACKIIYCRFVFPFFHA